MRHVIAILALGSAIQCGRVQEPGRSDDRVPPATMGLGEPRDAEVPATPAAAAHHAPAQPERVARCMTPMPEQAPAAAAPAKRCPADPSKASPMLPRGRLSFPDAPGQPSIEIEVARAPEHRTRGLMYRTSLPANAGMLFSWSAEEPRSFWMRNTCIPLDMLFVAGDGTIVGVLEQVPTLNDDARRAPCPAQHVLEVNAGWTRAHGVKPGQRIVIEG